MAEKRTRYDRCIHKGSDGKSCRGKRLRDSPWALCNRHETLKLVEMRAKMRDEEAERQRIPLAQAIFVELVGRFAYTITAPYPADTRAARELTEAAFVCADEFLGVVKKRAVG